MRVDGFVCVFVSHRLSPRYLPDFVLHGTTENADQAFQGKVLKDLAHTVKVCMCMCMCLYMYICVCVHMMKMLVLVAELSIL